MAMPNKDNPLLEGFLGRPYDKMWRSPFFDNDRFTLKNDPYASTTFTVPEDMSVALSLGRDYMPRMDMRAGDQIQIKPNKFMGMRVVVSDHLEKKHVGHNVEFGPTPKTWLGWAYLYLMKHIHARTRRRNATKMMQEPDAYVMRDTIIMSRGAYAALQKEQANAGLFKIEGCP